MIEDGIVKQLVVEEMEVEDGGQAKRDGKERRTDGM